jgi:DNA-dependent RNA polymerase auxiliary subunit epsilon
MSQSSDVSIIEESLDEFPEAQPIPDSMPRLNSNTTSRGKGKKAVSGSGRTGGGVAGSHGARVGAGGGGSAGGSGSSRVRNGRVVGENDGEDHVDGENKFVNIARVLFQETARLTPMKRKTQQLAQDLLEARNKVHDTRALLAEQEMHVEKLEKEHATTETLTHDLEATVSNLNDDMNASLKSLTEAGNDAEKD